MCFSELYRKRPRRCDCKAGMNKDIGFSMTSVRAKYCCEIEINKSFSDPLLN